MGERDAVLFRDAVIDDVKQSQGYAEALSAEGPASQSFMDFHDGVIATADAAYRVFARLAAERAPAVTDEELFALYAEHAYPNRMVASDPQSEHKRRLAGIRAVRAALGPAVPNWVTSVIEERGAQDARWGSVSDNPHSFPEWVAILGKQFGQVADAANAVHYSGQSTTDLRRQLVQTMAVCVAMLDQDATPTGP